MEGEYINNSLNEMLDKLYKNRHIKPEETIEFALEAYSLCKKENYETGMAVALLLVGQAYGNTSKYEDGITYLFDSIKLSQNQDICDLQLLAYINIGNIYLDLGNYEKGLDYYNSAERLSKVTYHSKNYFKNFKVELNTAIISNNIGEIYRLIGCYEEAKIYYNLAVKIERDFNYEGTFGMILSNLGNVEYHLGNYEKAMEYLNEAISFLLHYDYKIGLVEAYGILALVHEKKENYEECEKSFLLAINIYSGIDYAYNKVEILIDFSNFLENIGKRELAIEKLDEAYNISIDKKMYAKTMEICKRAIRLYEKANDADNANKYYKLYFEIEKKLEPIEFENRAKNLKTKIDLDSLENENKSILEKSETFRRKAEDLIEVIKNITIIGELGQKITTTLDLNKIYEMIYNTIQSFMKASAFGVGLYDDVERKIQYPYCVENNERTEMNDTNLDNEASIAVKCLSGNKIIVINDMLNEYLNYIEDVNYITDNNNSGDLNSAIFCPLIIDKSLIGVMTVQACEKDSFTMLKVEMIKALSSYAAIAINNAMKSKSLLVEVEQRRKFQAQLEDTNNKLIYLSENDGLTDIPNRRKFDLIITEEWNMAKEKKSVLSLIILDIDCFKQYNDNFGHTEGDRCLISISNELTKSLVNNYFAARLGGDEFVIVLPDTNLDEAIRYGENFRRNVEKLSLTHKFSKVSDIVTVTLGASSVIPNNDIEINQLIRQADNALYEAKANGKNQIVGF